MKSKKPLSAIYLVGLILAYIGALSVSTQGFFVGKLTSLYAENRVILVSVIILAAGLASYLLRHLHTSTPAGLSTVTTGQLVER